MIIHLDIARVGAHIKLNAQYNFDGGIHDAGSSVKAAYEKTYLLTS